MIDELIRIVEQDSPGIGPSIHRLYEMGAITDNTIRRSVIGFEFFRIFKTSERTARDIELELAARYDITEDGVNKIRRSITRGGRRNKPGRKCK